MMSSGYSLQQKYCRENHVQPCPSCVQMESQTDQGLRSEGDFLKDVMQNFDDIFKKI